jgi:hypothetical protein
MHLLARGGRRVTRAEHVLPKRVPIPCWRCGQDTSAGFDTVTVRGVPVPVHKRGDATCVPRLVPRPKEAQ